MTNIGVGQYVNAIAISTGGAITASNIYGGISTSWSGAAYYQLQAQVSNSTFSNCYFMHGQVRLDGVRNTFTNCKWEGNSSTKCVMFQTGVVVDTTFDNCDFGANTTVGDVFDVNGYYIDVLVKNSAFSATEIVDGDVLDDTFAEGSNIRIASYDDDSTDHRSWWYYGETVSTGTGLSDTTVRTAGGQAIRFEPKSSTKNLEWQFTIPTGNIQNDTMMVGVWCKINNANYYSGTHQMPRLTIDYDDGTTAYVEAAQSTDWQFLPLPFTPTTTFGEITVTISARTDQTTTNAYVYFDDFSTIYPASKPLNAQTFDLWAGGLPVTPPLATVLSAEDVWNVDKSMAGGANTVGQVVTSKLLTVAKFLGLK